jgi:peptidyl-prolyl cis-trans isomerase SurA
MKLFRHLAALICLSLPCFAQQVVDRMVAVVNNRVVTQSDWDEQEHFEALAEGRSPKTAQHSAATLERLIDRQLICAHIAVVNFQHATPEQVAKQIDEIRKQLPAAQGQTDEAWKRTLVEYSIAEEDLEQIITEQLDVLRFVDFRFRPSIQVAPEEVEAYYKQTLLPEMKKAGTNDSQLPPLKDVQEKIRELLVEQRVNEILNNWMQTLRAQANIRRLVVADATEQSVQKPAEKRQ